MEFIIKKKKMKKTKITVDFNGTKQGLKVSCSCEPGKDIYILVLAKKNNLYNYYGATTLGDEMWWITGPAWYRDWKIIAYEFINGEAIIIDTIINNRYGKITNFYLLGGESIETHFTWCNTIKEYKEIFNCKAQIETEYADILSKSFPEIAFYTEMPSIALRPNNIGYNICRDLTLPNRQDWQSYRVDIQFYNWWHPRPPHNLTDKEIARDIIFGPDLKDPFFDINRSPEQTLESLYLILN